jgi:hypothetical protein
LDILMIPSSPLPALTEAILELRACCLRLLPPPAPDASAMPIPVLGMDIGPDLRTPCGFFTSLPLGSGHDALALEQAKSTLERALRAAYPLLLRPGHELDFSILSSGDTQLLLIAWDHQSIIRHDCLQCKDGTTLVSQLCTLLETLAR